MKERFGKRKRNLEYKKLLEELNNLKRKYRHYQVSQEFDKRELYYYKGDKELISNS